MGLSVKNLSISRAGKTVIAGLGFELAKGEALFVRGPNGVGKSTLLRGLAGLLEVSGEISIESEDMSYAGHQDALKAALTVAENLDIWAGLSGGNDIAPAIEAFALKPLLDQPVMICSAGQKRRAGLARLLLEKRSVWLMDEPSVALDHSAVKLLEAAVQTHLASGGMALIATHVPLAIDAGELMLSPTNSPAVDPFLSGAFT